VFAPEQLGTRIGDAVEKQFAVEVIQLMLDRDRLKSFAADDAVASVLIKKLDYNLFGAFHVTSVVRDAHTPFAHGFVAAAFNDLRIYHYHQAVVVFVPQLACGYIHNGYAQGDTDLGSGYAHRMA
jgi:hypothetical protein